MIPTKSYQKREGGGNIMEGVNVWIAHCMNLW
jgi:hypothetical protein